MVYERVEVAIVPNREVLVKGSRVGPEPGTTGNRKQALALRSQPFRTDLVRIQTTAPCVTGTPGEKVNAVNVNVNDIHPRRTAATSQASPHSVGPRGRCGFALSTRPRPS